MEKMSRHNLLEWINTTAHVTHKKIEELCSGIAYCLLMEQLFPHCIGLKKVKMNAKLEHEYLHNLRLFQGAFLRLNLSKGVPIDRIIKGRFQDNLEFLQWFKKFYDNHGRENNNNNNNKNIVSQSPSPTGTVVPIKTNDKLSKPIAAGKTHLKTPEKDIRSREEERSVSPATVSVLLENVEQLAEQCTKMEFERTYYFTKLSEIETLLKESIEKEELVDWSARALKVLYDPESNAETKT